MRDPFALQSCRAGTVTGIRGHDCRGLTGHGLAAYREPVYDLLVTVERPVAETAGRRPAPGDLCSRRWVEQLHPGYPRHDQAVATLHDVLRRAAHHELRRRGALGPPLAGPELDDVAQQCADDALVNILAKLDDFKGLSRFTTWAYKFAIFEVSSKLARHAWQRHPPSREELELAEIPDSLTSPDQAERREQLVALKGAIEGDWTPRQREVFVAVALTLSSSSWAPTATRSTRTCSMPAGSCATALPRRATRSPTRS